MTPFFLSVGTNFLLPLAAAENGDKYSDSSIELFDCYSTIIGLTACNGGRAVPITCIGSDVTAAVQTEAVKKLVIA